MRLRVVTGIVIGAAVLGLVGYDVYAYVHGDASTISEWIWRISGKMPLIPFAGGLLTGHLFWQSAAKYRGE